LLRTYVVVEVLGSLISGRTYGLEIDVFNPPSSDLYKDLEDWSFKLSITDGEGFGRDGAQNP